MVVNGHVTRPTGRRLTEKEIAVLLGVSPRSNGKYYLEDICTSGAINAWSQFKPVRFTSKSGNLTLADMQAANYGFDFAGVLARGADLISAAHFAANFCLSARGSWEGLYRTPRGRIAHV